MTLSSSDQILVDAVIGAVRARSCLGCAHFRHAEELCALAKMRPPAHTIVHGCSAHEPDPIPF